MSIKDEVRWAYGGMLWKTKPASGHGEPLLPVAALRKWLQTRSEEQQYDHPALDTAGQGSIMALLDELEEV